MKKIRLLLFTLTLVGVITGCSDNDDDNAEPKDKGNDFTVPDTYKWNDVDYAGQTARIKLLDKLSAAVTKAGDGKKINEQNLIDIYENNGVISAGDNLAEKTFPQDKQWFYDWFAKLDSLTNNNGGQIKDGRFFTSNGVEISQMVEKGLMGACFYWQATSDYLHELGAVSNENPEEGSKATTREHHFDEAFGYLGVPTDLPNNDKDEVAGEYKNSSWFWGHYLRSRNSELQNKETLFDAFLKGRAAITQQKPEKRKEAVKTIRKQWELLVAANVAHYINSTISDIENNATASKWHHWSEAKAFHMALKYNVDKQISNSKWQEIDNLLKSNPKAVSKQDLQDANSKLDQVYDFPTNITNF